MDFDPVSGNQKPDGRLNFTYTYTETASAADQVEIYLLLLENAATSYVDELLKKNAGSSENCKKAVKNCLTSIPDNSIAPLREKVKERLVKIQEIELQLETNSNLCSSFRFVQPPPSCETEEKNYLNNLSKIISEDEMVKLESLLNDAINSVTSYLDSCSTNKCPNSV